MFIGHGMVAFAIAASVATYRGWDRERALTVGLVAGLFATLPDVDMLYAVGGLLGSVEGVFVTSDAFWAVANEVHRGATHSLVVGGIAGIGFAGWRGRVDWRMGGVGVAALVGLVAVGAAVGGPVTAAVLAAFVLGGVVVVSLAERFGFGAWTVLGVALLGLLSHPFGDLLTGQPPALLYPLDAVLLTERVTLHADPTLHLLGAFFVELVTIWLALLVVVRLRGHHLPGYVSPRATLGVGYAGAVFAIPAPTLEVASPFVFSVLAVGVVGVPLRPSRLTTDRLHVLTTALAAVTIAALVYTGAYLVVAL